MELYINTIKNSSTDIEVRLIEGNVVISSIIREAHRQQAEKLLAQVDEILRENCLGLGDIDSIIVEDGGGTFTALRIGIVTANTLAFALGIPVYGARSAVEDHINEQNGVRIVKPKYSEEPNITQKKAKLI